MIESIKKKITPKNLIYFFYMRILLISSYIFGYMNAVVKALTQMGLNVEVLYYENEPLKFRYKDKKHHLLSFLRKAVGGHAKKEHRQQVLRSLYDAEKFDQILVIHPQYLNAATHKFLKDRCEVYKTFLFDSLKKMPRQRKVLNYFNEIYSYEKADCAENDLKFLTNFIPSEALENKNPTVDFFNISSHDRRLPHLHKIAAYLEKSGYSYELIMFSKKIKKLSYVAIINKKMESEKIKDKIERARVLIDIQRKEQKGLSFRIFEAMGLKKKLITTNADIVHYDFYRPQNILVIDPDDIKIPQEFIRSPYSEIPEDIFKKYTAQGWVKHLFFDTNA